MSKFTKNAVKRFLVKKGIDPTELFKDHSEVKLSKKQVREINKRLNRSQIVALRKTNKTHRVEFIGARFIKISARYNYEKSQPKT